MKEQADIAQKAGYHHGDGILPFVLYPPVLSWESVVYSAQFNNSEFMEENMQGERKTLTQLSVPICLETLFYMLSGMVDTLMLSSVSDQAIGAVGTANTYIGVFIIMFGVISSGMVAVMSQNIGAGRPGIAYQARQLGLVFNALTGILISVVHVQGSALLL